MAAFVANSRVTVGGVAYRPGEKIEAAQDDVKHLVFAGYLIPDEEQRNTAPEKPKKQKKA